MDKNTYFNLVEFWDEAFKMSKDDKRELLSQINPDEDYKTLAPSQKQFDCLTSFNGFQHVLDYGCGSGWASIIMAKSGTKKIAAVDVSKNSIEMTNCYAKAFQIEDIVDEIFINENWLKQQKSGSFDGFFCSNVIDVVPLDMAEEIIKESARVVKKDARVVFSLNFYIEPKLMLERGAITEGPHVYLNGVLRLTSLKDEEWLEIFKKYYELVSLDYFAWPGEQKETRRLFTLKPLKENDNE